MWGHDSPSGRGPGEFGRGLKPAVRLSGWSPTSGDLY